MRKNNTLPFTRWVRAVVLCAMFFSPLCPSAVAAEGAAAQTVKEGFFPPSSWTLDKTYPDKIAHKLGFGFLNISVGWMAVFYEPLHGNYFFDGLAKGIFYALTNTAGGALQAVTFPFPVDIPLPHGGISYEYNR